MRLQASTCGKSAIALPLSYLASWFIEVDSFAAHVHSGEMPRRVRLPVVPTHHRVVPPARDQFVVGFRIEGTRKYP